LRSTERAHNLPAETSNILSFFFFYNKEQSTYIYGLNLKIKHGILYRIYQMGSCSEVIAFRKARKEDRTLIVPLTVLLFFANHEKN